MYVMRPHGVSRWMFPWSRGTHSPGVRFWNFTASQPDSTAPSISFLARSSDPLCLIPIAAITKTAPPTPTQRSPIRTLGALMLPSIVETKPQYPLRELAERAVAAPGAAHERDHLADRRQRVRGCAGQPGRPHQLDGAEVVDVVADVGEMGGAEPRRGHQAVDLGRLVLDPEAHVAEPELLPPPRHAPRGLAGHDRGVDAGVPQALHAHAVADGEALELLAALGVVHARVGEHAVAVGDDQAHPRRARRALAGGQHHHIVNPPSTT